MDDIYEVSLLIDFYGQLLTVRQSEILNLYYSDDLSLGEIAEVLNISRQGVYDNLKRGKKVLFQMEEKLELVQKFNIQKTKLYEALEIIDKIDFNSLTKNDKNKVEMVKVNLQSMVEDFL